jgi:hypothetical protein
MPSTVLGEEEEQYLYPGQAFFVSPVRTQRQFDAAMDLISRSGTADRSEKERWEQAADDEERQAILRQKRDESEKQRELLSVLIRDWDLKDPWSGEDLPKPHRNLEAFLDLGITELSWMTNAVVFLLQQGPDAPSELSDPQGAIEKEEAALRD